MPREAAQAETLTVQGVEIPKLGFGTWQITGRDCEVAVRAALELGYRHIDTARIYGNEAAVGRPLAQGAVVRDPTIREIAETRGKSPAQIVLRWLLDQPNVAAIPKASSHEHRAANLDVFDFELSDDERGAIAALERGMRTIAPSWSPDWDAP